MTDQKFWPCEHISERMGNVWFYSGQGLYVENSCADAWDICPVTRCHAKRPQEPKKLWERLREKVWHDPQVIRDQLWKALANEAIECVMKKIDEAYGKGEMLPPIDYVKQKLRELL